MKFRALSAMLLLGVAAHAQNPNLGTSGAQFLQIPVGAREAAMAGATVAHLQDASAVFWNPAGLTGVPSSSLFFAHTGWWASTKLNHAAFAQPAGGFGTVAVSFTILTMDPMEITTEMQPDGTGQTFDAQDLMIGVSFARRLTEDFSVGLTAKYVNQTIWNESASGFAFDVGTQYRVGFRDLTIAMSMTNFGPDMRYDGRDLAVKYDGSSSLADNRLTPARLAAEDFPLPLHFQVGLAMTVVETDGFSALAAVDVTHPNDNRERVNVGAELRILENFALRGGYRVNYDNESGTFGAGVTVPLGGARVAFDYCYALYDLLPDIHRIAMGLTF